VDLVLLLKIVKFRQILRVWGVQMIFQITKFMQFGTPKIH